MLAPRRLTREAHNAETVDMSPHSGAPTLLLIPTALEARRLEDQGGFGSGLALQALCGFGPVAAAARTAELIAVLRPARVLLVGIAGSYDTRALAIGSASDFEAVAIDGIGVGEAETFLGPPALGFPQWPGESRGRASAILDRIDLSTSGSKDAPDAARRTLLLTTCGASDSPAQAQRRHERFPEAIAEDMEGFGVAMACTLAGVPLTIVRGISNAVGDRDPAHWRIPAALAAARSLALEILRGEPQAPSATRTA